MKKLIFILTILLFLNIEATAQIAINNSNTPPNPTAILDVNSPTKGILIPRLTAFQKAAINPVPTGLMVYDATLNQFSYFNGSIWIDVSGASGSPWTVSSPNSYYNNSGNVGIGTTNPTSKLDVLTNVSNSIAVSGINSAGGYGVYGRSLVGGFGVIGEAFGANAKGGLFFTDGSAVNETALHAETISGGTAAFFTAPGASGKGLIVKEGSVGIGTINPSSSAKLEVNSTDKGFLLPRMTVAQRNAIVSPANGLIVFVNETQSIWGYGNGSWSELTSVWQTSGASGNEIKNINSGGFWSANPVGLTFASTNATNPPTAPVSGSGTRMMWIPSRSAFRVGTISNSNWDADSLGLFSFASGFDTKAKGNFTFATGNLTKATGVVSTAMGNGSVASGNRSMAMNSYTEARGYSSTAMGVFSIASGSISTAMGEYTIAQGDNSTSMGSFTNAFGYSSTAMGQSTHATGAYSTSMGYRTVASGDSSVAMGSSTLASGRSSTALGVGTKATCQGCTAMGNKTQAITGFWSTAMGNLTKASGFASTAMGFLTESSAVASMAMGDRTIASGNNSTAIGASTIASGSNSTAMGYNSKAQGEYSNVLGVGRFTNINGCFPKK
jgi:hypothetical protein